jgi:hypothetical protein
MVDPAMKGMTHVPLERSLGQPETSKIKGDDEMGGNQGGRGGILVRPKRTANREADLVERAGSSRTHRLKKKKAKDG